MPYHLQEFYNDLAELGARAADCKTALIVERKHETSEARVIGRYGAMFDPPGGRMPPLLPAGESQAFFRDITTDERLAGHPIQAFYPAIKSLFVCKLTNDNGPAQKFRHTLAVCNLPEDMWDNPDRFSNLSHVANLCRKYMRLVAGQLIPDVENEGFAEQDQLNATVDAESVDPASRFLFETLSKKQSLHERNGYSYVALRAWRKAMKQHQIDALVAVKHDPPRRFVNLVADEMAERVNVLYGKKAIGSVVPVPSGSSGNLAGLSVQLAEQVAEKLGAKFTPCLESTGTAVLGKSHPKKSARLQPYKLTEKPKGLALVIDDVATSGRHLELAQKAIRNNGGICFAMSWIGP